MPNDAKQTAEPVVEERTPESQSLEKTAADQVQEALNKADTVVELGLLTGPVPDPFETAEPSTEPEPVEPAATPNDETGSGKEPD